MNERCIAKTANLSYCGKNINGEWAFVNPEHAENAERYGSVMTPCPECMKVIGETDSE